MPSKGKIKGKLNRYDKWRAIVTDTSPFEVPVIFSNDGFYKNILSLEGRKPAFVCFVNSLISGKKKYTIPYRYKITKDEKSFRQLSLIHPASQVSIANFYEKFDQLICYYCQKGNFSIRYPRKVGSLFYFNSPVSDKNKFKNNSVDTSDIDKLVKNPASYFSYGGYNRLYRFFKSNQFLQLEKKYRNLTSLDIGKCFDSIYTHSVSWALKDIEFSKEFTNHHTFGDEFDKLMQKSNYMETNGICIGSEASRIFSEIILSRIDYSIEIELKYRGIRRQIDYDIIRYVDNYYVFTNNNEKSELVEKVIQSNVNVYKLHLNDGKKIKYERPFYTKKSKITDGANSVLNKFFDYFIENEKKGARYITFPNKVRKPIKLSNILINDIKSICYDIDANYHDVASYIVSAMWFRISQMSDSYPHIVDDEKKEVEDYLSSFFMIMELSFYFFTVSPKVSSSMWMSMSILSAANFIKSNCSEKMENFLEHVLNWVIQLSKSPEIKKLTDQEDVVPIELLNVIVVLCDLTEDTNIDFLVVEKFFPKKNGRYRYFEIICGLYIAKNNPDLNFFKAELIDAASDLILDNKYLPYSSECIHLLLDILSCPYVPKNSKVDLLRKAWPVLKEVDGGLINFDNSSANSIVNECESMHWFVNWDGISLLSLIQKKQLSAVY
ncbi:antiviral reverse transcriptase Drt3b [Thalassospira lucentensis]|uniref:antiviral reverse transcriptase Drt3b n=1 Tax=Thalassospira lucentensis TaxID=168935 RepID=UPI003AA996BD